jgi:arylsulfatase A-like enzyme
MNSSSVLVSSKDASERQQGAPSRIGPPTFVSPQQVLLVALWCGLVAGLLEIGMIVLKAHTFGRDRFYQMSRDFVWMIPLGNLMLFLGLGLILAITTWCLRRRGAWLSTRILNALTLLPAVLVAESRIYPVAWLIVTLAVAVRLVPIFERHSGEFRRFVYLTLPVLACVVAIILFAVFVPDRLRARHEAARPLPPTDSPNVLLIVLDTVRADHLSLYGYPHPTAPNLARLAQRGIRFDQARATSPWTLPSHASIFTGRWFHELSTDSAIPLDATYPTLAEFLGSRGYATAGFVANTRYCAYDSGLARGFTHYEDYYTPQLTGLRMAKLVDPALYALRRVTNHFLWKFGGGPEKKTATLINRQFLSWLSTRPEPKRPFFVFLNYFDAHDPYVLPEDNDWLMGEKPHGQTELRLLDQWYDWLSGDQRALSEDELNVIRNAYDNSLAYLDHQLGRLFDELERHAALDRTLVIITADHGEGIGEHGLHHHGFSLYQPEIHVPLIVIPPSRRPVCQVIDSEPVSIRDLPATIADLLGLQDQSPFPGPSLARYWRDGESALLPNVDHPVLSEAKRLEYESVSGQHSPRRRGPVVSLAKHDYVYIINEGDGQEEFYNVRNDPGELNNLIDSGEGQSVLAHLRESLVQFESGFSPVFRGRATSAHGRVSSTSPLPIARQ